MSLLSSALNSVEALLHRDAEATNEADPLAFSIARILLVATLIAAPWAFGAVVTWAWVALGLLAALVLFLWAVGSVQQGALKLVWSPLYVPLAMFFLLGLAQYEARLTLDTSDTRQALVLLAGDITFFFLAVQLFAGAGSNTCRTFGLTVLVFTGSLGLFAILQFASEARQIYGRYDTTGSLFGPYANPDHYAGLMEMLIPVAVLYIAERHRRHSVAFLALLVLATAVGVASLLLTGSRGGLIALLAETMIASVLFRWGVRSTKAPSLMLAAATTILAALVLFFWVDPGRIATRLGLVVTVDQSRKTLALDSLRMLRDHPVLGVGLGGFETAYPRYQSFPSDLWIDHAHNDYAEAVAETGLVGAALILSALALFFRLAFRDWGQRLRSGSGWIRLGAAIGCCGMLVHSFVDFNLHIPANAAWFAVLAGMATTAKPLRTASIWEL
jgi:O-antigen ligase